MARKLTWVASGSAALAVFYACSSPTPSVPRGGVETGGSTVTTGGSTAGGTGGTIGAGGVVGAGGTTTIAGGTGGKATGGTAAGGTGGASAGGAAGATMAGGTGGTPFPDPPNSDSFQYMSTGERGCSSANGCAGSCAIDLTAAGVGKAYRDFWEAPTGANYPDNSVQIPSMTSCQYSPRFPDNANFKGVPILGGLRGHALDNATKFNDFGDNYGERVRGFIKAPATGNYTFWLDSDNASQLYISTFVLLGDTKSDPSKATGVAFVDDYTVQGTFNGAGQKSQAVAMVQDNYYYFDFFHRAGGGQADHWEVRWTKPGQTMTFETVPASVIYSITPGANSPSCPALGTGGTGSGGNGGAGNNGGAAGTHGT